MFEDTSPRAGGALEVWDVAYGKRAPLVPSVCIIVTGELESSSVRLDKRDVLGFGVVEDLIAHVTFPLSGGVIGVSPICHRLRH